jgi:hypothetical protein
MFVDESGVDTNWQVVGWEEGDDRQYGQLDLLHSYTGDLGYDRYSLLVYTSRTRVTWFMKEVLLPHQSATSGGSRASYLQHVFLASVKRCNFSTPSSLSLRPTELSNEASLCRQFRI